MAPELFLNEEYNTSVDVYSYSMVLWELLNGKRVWWNETFPSNIAKKVAKGERPTNKYQNDNERSGRSGNGVGSGRSERSGSVITFGLANVMKDCWKDDPIERMTFTHVLDELDMLTRKSRRLSSSSSTSMSFEGPNMRK